MSSTLDADQTARVFGPGQVLEIPASPDDDYGRLAADCISAYVDAGQEHATLCGREMELEADRAGKKLDAIRRIMATENLLTGRSHSASSAEAVVETDLQYRAYLSLQSEVVVLKNHAFTLARAADLRAQLAVARFRAEGGFR